MQLCYLAGLFIMPVCRTNIILLVRWEGLAEALLRAQATTILATMDLLLLSIALWKNSFEKMK